MSGRISGDWSRWGRGVSEEAFGFVLHLPGQEIAELGDRFTQFFAFDRDRETGNKQVSRRGVGVFTQDLIRFQWVFSPGFIPAGLLRLEFISTITPLGSNFDTAGEEGAVLAFFFIDRVMGFCRGMEGNGRVSHKSGS